jgi:spore cortex formation protein SpoVR/YcgB (stage V sporulation)
MAQKEIDRINANGWARGWHATMLQREANQTGRTMATLHLERVANVSAFNVPAEATLIRGSRVHYRFLDGSECSHPYVKRQR